MSVRQSFFAESHSSTQTKHVSQAIILRRESLVHTNKICQSGNHSSPIVTRPQTKYVCQAIILRRCMSGNHSSPIVTRPHKQNMSVRQSFFVESHSSTQTKYVSQAIILPRVTRPHIQKYTTIIRNCLV